MVLLLYSRSDNIADKDGDGVITLFFRLTGCADAARWPCIISQGSEGSRALGTVINSHLLQRTASHYRKIISQFTFRASFVSEPVSGSGSNINPRKNVDAPLPVGT